jgi:hypothetical protein
MTAKPFKPCGGHLRAAIVTGGTHSRVCRWVKYYQHVCAYAVYVARRGGYGRRLVYAQGTQADALLHGCAEGWCLNMPGVWKMKGVAK